jgi:hypothetical protein
MQPKRLKEEPIPEDETDFPTTKEAEKAYSQIAAAARSRDIREFNSLISQVC